MLRGEMRHAQFDHFARANEQAGLILDAGEDALGQTHRGGGHGNRIGADFGAGAHFLGYGKGALEQLVQQQAQGAGFFSGLHRLFHLTQNLGFAQHHRIQPGGDAERVLRGLFLRQRIEVRREFVPADLVEIGQPLRHRIGGGGVAIQLGAVAGRQNGDFAGVPGFRQIVQRLHQLLGAERHLLADGERRGVMVNPECEKLHDGRRPGN
jgi:hypothetical protein